MTRQVVNCSCLTNRWLMPLMTKSQCLRQSRRTNQSVFSSNTWRSRTISSLLWATSKQWSSSTIMAHEDYTVMTVAKRLEIRTSIRSFSLAALRHLTSKLEKNSSFWVQIMEAFTNFKWWVVVLSLHLMNCIQLKSLCLPSLQTLSRKLLLLPLLLGVWSLSNPSWRNSGVQFMSRALSSKRMTLVSLLT